MPQQQQDGMSKVSKGDVFALAYLLFGGHAAALTPIIRSGHGSESFGIKAIIAMVFMAAFTGGQWASPMGLYMAIWFAFLVYRRVETFRNWRKGTVTHTRYIGDPWLASKFRFIKDNEQARSFEPVMCLLLGATLAIISPVVGVFVMVGFISLGVCSGIENFAVYKKVQHMNDAQIDGEYFAEVFKRGR